MPPLEHAANQLLECHMQPLGLAEVHPDHRAVKQQEPAPRLQKASLAVEEARCQRPRLAHSLMVRFDQHQPEPAVPELHELEPLPPQ